MQSPQGLSFGAGNMSRQSFSIVIGVHPTIPESWLPKPFEERLTTHPHRRSIPARRSSDGGCCPFRTLLHAACAPDLTQSPSLLRRIPCQRESLPQYGSFGTRVLMVIVSRRVPLPFLAPPLAPSVFFVIPPNPIQAGDSPSFLSATAPAGGFLHCLSRIGKGAINGRGARQKSH